MFESRAKKGESVLADTLELRIGGNHSECKGLPGGFGFFPQIDELGLVDGSVSEAALKGRLIDDHGVFHVVTLNCHKKNSQKTKRKISKEKNKEKIEFVRRTFEKWKKKSREKKVPRAKFNPPPPLHKNEEERRHSPPLHEKKHSPPLHEKKHSPPLHERVSLQ